MSNQLVPVNRPPSARLHPSVYAVIVGLTAWFVLSVWMLFGDSSYESVTDAMITVLFVMAVGIPTAIWLTWRRHPEGHTSRDEAVPPFRRWASGGFQTFTGDQGAWQAVVEILLPIVAVAFGITAFGLVYYLTSATTV